MDRPNPQDDPRVTDNDKDTQGTPRNDAQDDQQRSPEPPHLPSLRSASDTPMTASSTPLGQINAARRPTPAQMPSASARSGALPLPHDIQAKMKAFSLSRQAPPQRLSHGGGNSPGGIGTPAGGDAPSSASPPAEAGAHAHGPVAVGGIPQNMLANAPNLGGAPPRGVRSSPNVKHVGLGQPRPQPTKWATTTPMSTQGPPMTPAMGGLAAKRGMGRGMKLSDVVNSDPQGASSPRGRGGGGAGADGSRAGGRAGGGEAQSQFSRYADFVDTKTGSLRFKNKAVIHGGGIDFSTGRSFNISLDEVDTLDELGKGNYGTVYKVRHARPNMRRPGLALRGAMTVPRSSSMPSAVPTPSDTKGELSNVVMAMKEIRLELDESKFAAIIMELDILHRCVSPFIIDFYGAFFQEGAVYICVEFMDGGSVEKLYGDGIPENILRKITLSTIMGLKALKDEHNIIHRDVKPTNILVNTRGQIKICDFGVSGNLVASIAKTNIGCQSYMAPERISGGAGAGAGGGTYSVQSDVWSLGLTIIECAVGRYPYPPETSNNIFSQLNAIVQGEPPKLPEDGYSDLAKSFVNSCLNKKPSLRPTYAMLLRHPWLAPLLKPPSPSDSSTSATTSTSTIPTSSPTSTTTLTSPESPSTETEPEPEPATTPPTSSPALKQPASPSPSPSIPKTPDAATRADEIKRPAEGEETIDTADAEVAGWVKDALDRRARGVMGSQARPALHAVALDAVPGSPLAREKGGVDST